MISGARTWSPGPGEDEQRPTSLSRGIETVQRHPYLWTAIIVTIMGLGPDADPVDWPTSSEQRPSLTLRFTPIDGGICRAISHRQEEMDLLPPRP